MCEMLLTRKVTDEVANIPGRGLLYFLRDTRYCVTNEQLGPDSMGMYYSSSIWRSVIDCALVPVYNFDEIKSFKVLMRAEAWLARIHRTKVETT